MQFAENISNAISWESSQCRYPKNRKCDEKFIVQAVFQLLHYAERVRARTTFSWTRELFHTSPSLQSLRFGLL